MRRSVPFVLAFLAACAPNDQTATVSNCPEGTIYTGAGECEDEVDVFSDDEQGDVNGGDGSDDESGGSSSGDSDGGGSDGGSSDGGDSDGDDSDGGDDDSAEDGPPSDLDPLEEDVSGRSYALDLGTAEWVKPDSPLLETLLGDALDVQVLVGVQDVTDDTLDLVGALPDTSSEDLVQDTCLPTLDFESIDFTDSPYFRAGPTDFPIEFSGVSLTIAGMEISGIFEPDGESMYGVGVSGALDLRDIGPALGDSDIGLPVDLSDADQICDWAAILSISCEACPTDGEEYCLEVELDEIVATEIDLEIEILSEDDIDPECE